MNIYNHIDKNKQETWFIMFCFIVFMSFLGWFLGTVFFEDGGTFFMGVAFLFAGISSFFSYYFSDQLVLALTGAYEIAEKDNPYVFKIVQNLSIGSGLPMPRVFIIEDTAMNAFATGRDPKHAVICLTTGIIQRLDKLELEGVVAHEMSHIQNYDIRLMSIVSILVGSITLMADFFTRGFLWGGGRRRRSEGEVSPALFLIGIALVLLSPIIAQLIKLAVSRNREYLADASAALLTRYPKGLADALKKLSGDHEILEAANGATAHMYIVSPLLANGSGGSNSGKSWLADVFETHPPIEDRIDRLMKM